MTLDSEQWQEPRRFRALHEVTEKPLSGHLAC